MFKRKTSSSSPRHHKSPPDSHQCPGGRDSRLPHIHPRKQGVRGQVGRAHRSAPVSLMTVLSCWELRLNPGLYAHAHSHLGHQLSWCKCWLMATASPYRGRGGCFVDKYPKFSCLHVKKIQACTRACIDTHGHTQILPKTAPTDLPPILLKLGMFCQMGGPAKR